MGFQVRCAYEVNRAVNASRADLFTPRADPDAQRRISGRIQFTPRADPGAVGLRAVHG
jgi:hypothetical protein